MGPAAVTSAAAAWGGSPGRSARSTLVTILGDAIAPTGGDAVWFAALARLAAVFGFNERLVRTSLSRLAADGWVDSERVGRRSRYTLTAYGHRETRQAEHRIYGPPRSDSPDQPRPDTPDRWHLVLTGPGQATLLVTHLRWRGFAEISPGVWAHPLPVDLDSIDRRLADPFPPTAVAEFDDPALLARSDTFRASTGLDRAEAAYGDFIEHYRPLMTAAADTPEAAFALRTMLVHDYRRIRLAEPDLPADVLDDDWVGHAARRLTADAYHRLSPLAWAHVAHVTGLTPPDLERRFTEPVAA